MTYNVFGGTLNPTLLLYTDTKALARYSLSVESLILIICGCGLLQNVMKRLGQKHLMSREVEVCGSLKFQSTFRLCLRLFAISSTDISCGAESASGLDHVYVAELPAATSRDTSSLCTIFTVREVDVSGS